MEKTPPIPLPDREGPDGVEVPPVSGNIRHEGAEATEAEIEAVERILGGCICHGINNAPGEPDCSFCDCGWEVLALIRDRDTWMDRANRTRALMVGEIVRENDSLKAEVKRLRGEEPQWKDELPTREGWYIVRHELTDLGDEYVWVREQGNPRCLVALFVGKQAAVPLSLLNTKQWSGPLHVDLDQESG